MDDPVGERPLTPSMPLLPDGTDATLLLVRHGESTFIAEDRFQGQAETPLSALGRRQAELTGRRLARPHDPPALPLPGSRPVELVHSPLERASETALAIEGALRTEGTPIARRAEPALVEIGQGAWEGVHRAEVDSRYAKELAAWRSRPLESWAPGGESLPEVQARVRPALAVILARLAEGRVPGSPDRPQVAGYRQERVDHGWSIVVAHDGVLKVALLTLFELPLDRFWMWSTDLCGMSVVEVRAGQAVMRAHNLTAHVAGLRDEETPTDLAERSRSGAL